MAVALVPSAAPSGVRQRVFMMLAVVAALILLVGSALTLRELWFQFGAARTTGIYTDSNGMIDAESGIPRILYLVRFTTKDGKTVEFYDQRLGEPLPEKTPFPVFYTPWNPQDARFVTSSRWDLASQLLTTGALLGLCGAGVRFIGARPTPRRLADSEPPV